MVYFMRETLNNDFRAFHPLMLAFWKAAKVIKKMDDVADSE